MSTIVAFLKYKEQMDKGCSALEVRQSNTEESILYFIRKKLNPSMNSLIFFRTPRSTQELIFGLSVLVV